MPPPDVRIAEISARLAAVGLKPHRKQYAHRITVEAALPPSFPAAAWPEVLAVLESADRFGFADSAERGRSLWAVIHTPSDPEAGAADDGTHLQP